MFTMFQVDKLLEIITKGAKSPQTNKKFQRSPKIIGYERSEYPEFISSELKEPLLSPQDQYIQVHDYCNDHQEKKSNKGVDNKSSVRVKVLLTKQEAAKLLAKCKEEGVLDFKDVVNELAKLPAQRINVVSSVPNNISSKDSELSTILEDEE